MYQEAEIFIPSEGVTLSGTLLLPEAHDRVPCVILAGGTMSHTRDGQLVDQSHTMPRRDALKRLAERLARAGYASIRWDKRGYDATPAGPRPTTNEDETADLCSVMRFARSHGMISRVVVAGESAGAYFACRAARVGVRADAYAFLGALCSSVENLFDYNYGRLREYAGLTPENRSWAEQTAPYGLALGEHYPEMIKAAQRGDAVFQLVYKEHSWTLPLARMRGELLDPPPEQFKYITSPALVLHGDRDLNVPPEDAATAERIMMEAGNKDVTRIMIPHADHSFQVAAPDEEQRVRERHSFASFNRPYHEDMYAALIAWLHRTVPTGANKEHLPEFPGLDSPRPGTVAWGGITVVENVTDEKANPGVNTLEGRIGPLLRGERVQAHYIDMPAGLYLAEHPHASESIIFTVRGRWVLSSGGIRCLMVPGTLFRFGAGVSTGYEVPFDEPAFILIFKGHQLMESDESFVRYLQGLAGRLADEQAGGTPFRLADLPPEHPARVFARRIKQ